MQDVDLGPVPGGALHFSTSNEPLATDTVYTATVVGAWDLYNNQMTAPHTWHFATRTTVPFTVTATVPEAGVVGVPLTATLALTFNKRLLAGSEDLVSFRLSRLDFQGFQTPVAGQVTRQGRSLRFTPDAALEVGTMYQAYVVGATSYLGDQQRIPHRWAFETVMPDPPQVTETVPYRDETNVPCDTAIDVSFDQALSALRGPDMAFTLMGPNGEVQGHLTWVRGDEASDGSGASSPPGARGWNSAATEARYQGYRGLRFEPLHPLAPGATYQVTVEGVQSVYGVSMAAPYTWTFTTDPNPAIFDEPEPVVTKYYYFGGQQVAMREDGVVYYLAGDHLGTTSVVLNENGTVHSQARHYPYGEERWRSPENGTLPTDYRFTGQRDVGLGLYHMGARFYDSYLNRFISPDSIIPQPENPQSLNRGSVTHMGQAP